MGSRTETVVRREPCDAVSREGERGSSCLVDRAAGGIALVPIMPARMKKGRLLPLDRPDDHAQRVGYVSLRVHPFAIGRVKEVGNFAGEKLWRLRPQEAREREIL